MKGRPDRWGSRRGSGSAKAGPASPEDPESARYKGIALLARRDYGTDELQGRLTAAGYTPAAVETALLALEAAGFLDDRRYAEHFVAYHAGRGQGPRRIRSGLRGKGLSVELATLAVDDTSAVWGQRAQDLRRRRFGVEAPASFAERARQSRFLLYRGFTPAQVRQAFAADQVDLHDLDLEAAVPEDSAHED